MIIVYSIGISVTATAQNLTPEVVRLPHVNLKVTPLSFIDPDATVQGAVETRLTHRHSIQAEFGYGGDKMRRFGFGPSPWTPNRSVTGKEVWRARLEGRYYITHSSIHLSKRMYVAIEGLFKQVNVAYLGTLQAGETIDPVFVYAPVTRHVYGIHNKVGSIYYLGNSPGSIWSHLFIDIYGGFGIRYINVVSKSSETDLLFENKIIYERFDYSAYRPGDTFWRLSISLGLKIGVSL
jgi:hypothetical protein